MSAIIINHKYLLRIAYYSSCYYPEESLSEELFCETFGSVMGKHYFEKWRYVVKYDILKMVAYFGIDTSEGQKFADMLAVKIEQYEMRVGR